VGLQGSEALYDYHRQWAGFLRRSGETAAAIERYEIANAIRSDAPARHVALGRLLLKTGDSAGALAAVDEALRRESLALEAVRARARASGASAEDHLEEGRTHVRIADALAFAVQVYPAAGRASDAAELGRRRSTHLEDARQAFQRNLQLDAVCGEGRSELARLRSKSEGSEP
jgi:tetratricopeptide (TPR) repeat protein